MLDNDAGHRPLSDLSGINLRCRAASPNTSCLKVRLRNPSKHHGWGKRTAVRLCSEPQNSSWPAFEPTAQPTRVREAKRPGSSIQAESHCVAWTRNGWVAGSRFACPAMTRVFAF